MHTKLVALATAVREALATPQSLIASSPEEKEARLDLIDLIPELNAALVGDVEYLRELSWLFMFFPLPPLIGGVWPNMFLSIAASHIQSSQRRPVSPSLCFKE